jgi:hypothetical protein
MIGLERVSPVTGQMLKNTRRMREGLLRKKNFHVATPGEPMN